jgi:hypothetical protein
LAKAVIVDSLTAGRMRSDSLFTRTLVRSLQVKNSFYYPFDSVLGISKIYAPDSAFRIFSWSISFDDYYARQRAAIQFKTRRWVVEIDSAARLFGVYRKAVIPYAQKQLDRCGVLQHHQNRIQRQAVLHLVWL